MACHFLLRGISRPRDRTCVSCISCTDRWVLYRRASWEDPPSLSCFMVAQETHTFYALIIRKHILDPRLFFLMTFSILDLAKGFQCGVTGSDCFLHCFLMAMLWTLSPIKHGKTTPYEAGCCQDNRCVFLGASVSLQS